MPAVPRLAATVMLVRPTARGLAVYLTRRSSRSAFLPDAFVFPGGAVDPDDRLTAGRVRGRRDGAAPELVAAAVRELFEEAGVLLAEPDPTGAFETAVSYEPSALRAERAAGVSFAALLERHALIIDRSRLAHYSNWITPHTEPIRFDAHFFLARAPEGASAVADTVEVHDGVWLTPDEALARAARGDLALRFPTRKHLERLARFDDPDTLFAHAGTRCVTAMQPVTHDDDTVVFDDASW